MIQEVEYEIQLNDLQPKQWGIIDNILSTPASVTKYWILKASRQSGKTYTAERVALAFSFEKSDQDGYIILATGAQCRKVFLDFLKFLPSDIIRSTNNSNGSRFILFENGTRLNFYSAGGCDSIVGNSGDFGVLDEAALYTDLQFSLIRPIFSAKKNAKVLVCSTPRGKNWYYKMWKEGLSEDPFVQCLSMSYHDNKFYDLREIERAKISMPPELFAQEYLAKFAEGISSVFGDISAVQTLKEFPKYYDPNEKFFYGLDCSGAGSDKTVLTVLNKDGVTVLIYETKELSTPAQARELSPIIKQFGNIRGYIEINGLGAGLCDTLEELGINVDRWITTNDSKQELVTELLKAIGKRDVTLPHPDLCPELDDQMCQYLGVRTATNKIRYTHPVGGHDDYPDSLMMANKARIDLQGDDDTSMVEIPCDDYDGYDYAV